jgi:tripartite-type tricarboxylate transporter receptor subunit TctC
MSLTRRSVLHAGAALLGTTRVSLAQAGPWPSRSIRIIVPTAPGGSPDVVARLLGNKFTERLGQAVVVESIPQGVGLVGNQLVAKSEPDGHTLAMLTGGFTAQAAVVKALPFDPLKDFAFVTSVVAYPMVYAVVPSSPIVSFKELVERAKTSPGKVSYGTVGGGSVYHLLGKWVDNQAGIDMLLVPYRGSVPAFTDLIGGRVDTMLDTATSAIPRIRNGQLRALAVSSPERYPLLPDTPTIAETVPGINVMSWLGFAAAANTPRSIVEKINSEVRHALESEEIKKWLTEAGVLAAPSTPEEFRARIAGEIGVWKKIVDANGITSD